MKRAEDCVNTCGIDACDVLCGLIGEHGIHRCFVHAHNAERTKCSHAYEMKDGVISCVHCGYLPDERERFEAGGTLKLLDYVGAETELAARAFYAGIRFAYTYAFRAKPITLEEIAAIALATSAQVPAGTVHAWRDALKCAYSAVEAPAPIYYPPESTADGRFLQRVTQAPVAPPVLRDACDVPLSPAPVARFQTCCGHETPGHSPVCRPGVLYSRCTPNADAYRYCALCGCVQVAGEDRHFGPCPLRAGASDLRNAACSCSMKGHPVIELHDVLCSLRNTAERGSNR